MIGVKVDGYNFGMNGFAMCLEAQLSCDEREMSSATARYRGELRSRTGDLHHLTRSCGRYLLRVELPTDRALFIHDAA